MRIDQDLSDEIMIIRKEAARLCNGVLNYALVADTQFKSLLSKRNALARFPLTERDFRDLIFYENSTVGLTSYQINIDYLERDHQIEIIVSDDIKKKDFIDVVWKAVEPYTLKTKAKGSEQLELVYAVKKARKQNMKSKQILEQLCIGELPNYPKKLVIAYADLNTIMYRAEQSISLKDTP